MRYCYRCPECGATREEDTREWRILCAAHGGRIVEMRRDYRAEGVGIGRGVRESQRDDALAM